MIAALRTSDAEVASWSRFLGKSSVQMDQPGIATRQRQIPNNVSHNIGNVSHVRPLSRSNHRSERGTMSFAKDQRTLGERISKALGRRIGYGITRKQLQQALNVSSGTVDNLLSGRQDPSPRVFMALLQFFDSAFSHEILAQDGFTLVKLADAQRLAAAQKIIEGVQALNALEGQP